MDTCTLCGLPRNEAKSFTAGKLAGTFVCNRCVAAAQQTKEAPQPGKREVKPLPKPQEIYASLNQYVVGQEQAKRSIAIAVYNHYKRREAVRKGGELGGVEIQKSNIMLLGPSGSGKTEIARTVSRELEVPFYVADATKLTSSGYVGDDVESLLQGLLADCGGDIEKAEWGLLFLDEFDKLARKSGRNATGYRDVTGEGVQQALLKMIEGTRMPTPRGVNQKAGANASYDMIDTSNILFICAGSFAGIEDQITRKINREARVGFGATGRVEVSAKEIYEAIDEEDFLEFGIIPEMLGRLPVRTSTFPLSEDDLYRILTEPKNSLIRQYQALYRLDGVELGISEEALRAIARKAHQSPTGARALRTLVEKILGPYSFWVPSDPTVAGVRITEEVVDKGEPAEITRRPEVATA